MPYADPVKNKECQGKWREEHAQELKQYAKEYYSETREERQAYRDRNRDYINERKRNYYSGGKGRELTLAGKKRWYAKHKRKILKQQKSYYVNNKSRIDAQHRKYAIVNKSKLDAARRKWKCENPELYRKQKRQDYVKHREARLKTCKVNYEKNKPRYFQYAKNWSLRNAERVKEMRKRYKKAHPELSLHYTNKRRAIVAGVTFDDSAKQFYAFVRSQKTISCAYCNKIVEGKKAHVDHVLAISKGGAHVASNLRATCQTCNLKKSTKPAHEFIRTLNKGL